MYTIIKTVTRNGKHVSEESSDYYNDWNAVKDALKKAIKDRLKEAKERKKPLINRGGGTLMTLNGFKIQYDIYLLTRVIPEDQNAKTT